MRAKVVTSGILFTLTAAFYARVGWFDFINYDDNRYFYENLQVISGLSWENIKWAFEIHGPSMWIPATWLSHQISVSLFGTSPGPQHLINALLHASNAVLVFILLSRLVGNGRPAALTAALFAFHPIHVESVAWITERKDVLSLFFSLAALIVYLRFQENRQFKWFVPVFILHAFAVMAKPLAVTLPCVMLLFDFLAFRRARLNRTWLRVIFEKLPLLAISGFASYMTILCQRSINAIGSLETFPFGTRLANAILSYATYLLQLVFPVGLTPFYPYSQSLDNLHIVVSACVLVTLSIATLALYRKNKPEFLVGWLWYLGTLVPMIGIVQAGSQSMANRYAYLPFIGLYLAFGHGFNLLLKHYAAHRKAAFVCCSLPLLAIAILSYLQIGYWKNTQTLFSHAIAVNPQNYLAHNNLALALKDQGDSEAARHHFEAALASNSTYTESINNLGLLDAEAGDLAAAEKRFLKVLEIKPRHPIATHNLAKIAFSNGEISHAESLFRSALANKPNFADAHYDLGYLLMQENRIEEAAQSFKNAIQIAPDRSNARINYAIAQSKLGNIDHAFATYREVLTRDPSNELAARNFALLLFETGRASMADNVLNTFLQTNPQQSELRNFWATSLRERGLLENAVEQYEFLAQADPDNADNYNNLGVVYGRMDDHAAALFEFERALAIQPHNPRFLRNKASAEAKLIELGEL